jgi:thiol-disulfide isomerase/thioredoxin
MKASPLIRKTIVSLIVFSLGAAAGAAVCFFVFVDRVIREDFQVRQAEDHLITAGSLRLANSRADIVPHVITRQEEDLMELLDNLRRPFFADYTNSTKPRDMSKKRLRVFQEAKEHFEQYGWGRVETNGGWAALRGYLKQVPYTQERQEWDQWNARYKGPNPLPAPELAPLEWLGQPQRPQDLSNHVVLVVFWGIRCGPCLRELPEVQKLHELYGERGLKIVAIHTQRQHDKAKAYLAEQKYAFPAALLLQGSLCDQYLVRGLPASFLIDKQGHILRGPEHELPSREQIETLLAGPAA